MKKAPHTTRGSILMITLMLLCVMGILAVSFLLIGVRDYRVSKHAEWSVRSFYLARSGLEYYAINAGSMPSGTTKTITVETEGQKDYCEIVVGDDFVIATGIIAHESGEKIAQRSLKAPTTDVGSWYEVVR
jgi:Tfp pilus assembly protein PilX